jgi:hypothetical protein
MQDGLSRLQAQCRATAAFRIRKIAELPVYRAQQEPGFGILRPLFTEAGTCFLRLGVALLLEQIFYLRLVHYQHGFFKKSYMCFVQHHNAGLDFVEASWSQKEESMALMQQCRCLPRSSWCCHAGSSAGVSC